MKSKKNLTLLFVVPVLFFLYAYYETYNLKITCYTINSEFIPPAFSNKSIVFVSDIHHGPFFSLARVTSLVNKINALHPDIITLGGDYVHRGNKYIIPVFNELAKLKCEHGIYAVLGNHDHWENKKLTRQKIIENGFKDCDNKSYWVKIGEDSIKIGGVGDLWTDKQIPDSTTFDMSSQNFGILLSHNPDYLERLRGDAIDLTLSGHTHGGQVTFFGLFAPILPSHYGQKYRYGMLQSGKRTSIISSGVGTITPPLRFFCRPEIVCLKLVRTSHEATY